MGKRKSFLKKHHMRAQHERDLYLIYWKQAEKRVESLLEERDSLKKDFAILTDEWVKGNLALDKIKEEMKAMESNNDLFKQWKLAENDRDYWENQYKDFVEVISSLVDGLHVEK